MFNVKVNELSYDEFMKDLNGGKVTELTITPKVRTETYMLEGNYLIMQKMKVLYFTYRNQKNSFQK